MRLSSDKLKECIVKHKTRPKNRHQAKTDLGLPKLHLPEDYPWEMLVLLFQDLAPALDEGDKNRMLRILRNRRYEELSVLSKDWSL